MNFATLKEYFYKLSNRCYLLVLLPLIVFIYIYQQLISGRLVPLIKDEKLGLIIIAILTAFALINLTSVHWIALRRLSLYSSENGLGRKLDRYVEIVMFRIGACSASSLMMAAGLLCTGSEVCAGLFVLILAWTVFQWPGSRRACRDLRLKGDEEEMVLYKKDGF